MKTRRNQFNIPQYEQGDSRRLLVLLASIDLLGRPSQAALADLSGYAREDIDAAVARLREEFAVNLHKVGEVYHIEAWGQLLQPEGVRQLLAPD